MKNHHNLAEEFEIMAWEPVPEVLSESKCLVQDIKTWEKCVFNFTPIMGKKTEYYMILVRITKLKIGLALNATSLGA